MYVLYIDESGCLGSLVSATSEIQPAFVIAGVIVEKAKIRALTHDFLNLKKQFNPNLLPATEVHLSWALAEIKGSDVRGKLRASSRRQRTHAVGFLDSFIAILEKHQVRIAGKVVVKGIGQPINSKSLYTSSVQGLCANFQAFLEEKKSQGFVVLDSRESGTLDVSVAHSIFTQKFKATGDKFSRILEMPTFGNSKNMVGLQVADLLCSAVLFPMTTFAYCTGHVQNRHVNNKYYILRSRYGDRLRKLQYRYQRAESQLWTGGITVNDGILRRSGRDLFVEPQPAPAVSAKQDQIG